MSCPPKNHPDETARFIVVGFLAALVLYAGPARGAEGEQDARCRADAEEARRACTTTELGDGRGRDLLSVVDETNDAIPGEAAEGNVDFRSTKTVGARGANQAARYANRKDNSQALAELSRVKAESCQATSRKCRISCAIAEREHRSGATAFSAIDIADQAGQETQLAGARAGDAGTCKGYRANVEAAYRQSFAMAANKSINESGVGSTSADDSRLPIASAPGVAPVAPVAPDVAPIRVGGVFGETAGSALEAPVGGAPHAVVTAASSVPAVSTASGSRGTLPAASRAPAAAAAGVAAEARGGIGHHVAAVRANGVSGMSLPAVDGMTGPLGPSLFEKISSQYQSQDRNFIQERSPADRPGAQ